MIVREMREKRKLINYHSRMIASETKYVPIRRVISDVSHQGKIDFTRIVLPSL